MLLNGKKVYVGRFVPRKDRDIALGEKARKFTNVFIKNLSEEYDESKLTDMFNNYGKISSVKVKFEILDWLDMTFEHFKRYYLFNYTPPLSFAYYYEK